MRFRTTRLAFLVYPGTALHIAPPAGKYRMRIGVVRPFVLRGWLESRVRRLVVHARGFWRFTGCLVGLPVTQTTPSRLN